MHFTTLLATGAYLSTFVDASPMVEITNRLTKRDLVSRATYTLQGCYSEGTGTQGGTIAAGNALIGKTVAAPPGGLTADFCAQSCVGFVLFGLETASTGPPAEQTCYCGNKMEIGVQPVDSSTCNVACSGNSAQFCGAIQKLNIYLIQGAGAPGPIGPQGVPGANGAAGSKGATGSPGPAGINGNNGAAGVAGPVGAPGSPGVKGDPGLTGSTGAAGSQGAPGITGPAGTNGINGLTGAAGQAGSAGPKGDKGNAGAPGINGATGNPGQPGSPGIQGQTGPQGVQGLAGTDGAVGIAGPIGETGAPGPAGPCRAIGKDMGFEAIGGLGYDIPWDISPGFAFPGLVYDFQSTLDPYSGNQNALLDWTNEDEVSGRFQQQDLSLCAGTAYTFTGFLKWTATPTSITPPICVVSWYLGSDATGFNELATYPDRDPDGVLLPLSLPVDWTVVTNPQLSVYNADFNDEDRMLVVDIDCNGYVGNLGLIAFDTFRLAPAVPIKKRFLSIGNATTF